MEQVDDSQQKVLELKKRLRDFFGGAFRAVGERNSYDARSVLRVMGYDNGTYFAILFPNPAMQYELRISEIQETSDDEWIVTTNRGRWSFRKLSPEALAAYKKQMNSEGFHV